MGADPIEVEDTSDYTITQTEGHTMSTLPVCGEWTDAKYMRAQACIILQSYPFSESPFLVDRMIKVNDGPTRQQYGVYQGRVLARMLQDDLGNWYGVTRYVVINESVPTSIRTASS